MMKKLLLLGILFMGVSLRGAEVAGKHEELNDLIGEERIGRKWVEEDTIFTTKEREELYEAFFRAIIMDDFASIKLFFGFHYFSLTESRRFEDVDSTLDCESCHTTLLSAALFRIGLLEKQDDSRQDEDKVFDRIARLNTVLVFMKNTPPAFAVL